MNDTKINEKDEENRKHRIRAAAFLGTVAGLGAIAGFSKTVSVAKKQDLEILQKGGREAALLLDGGAALALRALGWGSLYAIGGTGIFCYGIWKLSGATNMDEFRMKMGSILPKLSKDGPPTSRTEFDGLTDLMNYISTWGKT